MPHGKYRHQKQQIKKEIRRRQMRSTLQERILVMSEESITTSLLARLFVLGVSCKMQER